jgi:cell division protein FtsB
MAARLAVTAQISLPFRRVVCLTARIAMKDEAVDLGIWDKLTRVVTFLIVVAVAVGIAYLCVPLMQQNERMRQRNLDLEAQIQREEDSARQLKASLDAQRSDPKAVERLAREKLGYAKPGEIVIRFQENPAQAAR